MAEHEYGPPTALNQVTDLDGDTSYLSATDFAKVVRARLKTALRTESLTLPDGVKLGVRSRYAVTTATVSVQVVGITWEQAHGPELDGLWRDIAHYCRGWSHLNHWVQIAGGPTVEDCTTVMAVIDSSGLRSLR